MSIIQPGKILFEQVIQAEDEGRPLYPSLREEDDMKRFPQFARLAMLTADHDPTVYQFERMRIAAYSQWVRGEIGTEKFNHDWEAIEGAIDFYNAWRQNDYQ